jgi:hypothetical protein
VDGQVPPLQSLAALVQPQAQRHLRVQQQQQDGRIIAVISPGSAGRQCCCALLGCPAAHPWVAPLAGAPHPFTLVYPGVVWLGQPARGAKNIRRGLRVA